MCRIQKQENGHMQSGNVWIAGWNSQVTDSVAFHANAKGPQNEVGNGSVLVKRSGPKKLARTAMPFIVVAQSDAMNARRKNEKAAYRSTTNRFNAIAFT
jgi:hypothetical protein